MDLSSRSIGLFLISLLGLAGCTYNPFVKDNQLTGSGAATAAGAGIGLGASILMSAPKPVIGVAGIVGGGVGYYLSSLRYASGGVISAGGVVFQEGAYVTIEVPTDKLFDSNTDEFLPGAEGILDSIAAVLSRYPEDNVMISGNTSGYASAKYEHKLSEDRARQVAAYLWTKGISTFRGTEHSMQPRRLVYVGYGNYFPIANDIKLSGIRANSRIQITAFPSQQLIHDKRYKVFNNVGDLGEPRQTTDSEPRDFNKMFPPGAPPGQAYKEQIQLEDGPVPQSYSTVTGRTIHHGTNYDENVAADSSGSSVPQTSDGISTEKQAGKTDWLWSRSAPAAKSAPARVFKE